MKIILSVGIIVMLSLQSCSSLRTDCGMMGYDHASIMESEKITIDTLLNEWHRDVATFKLKSYFEKMDSSFIFLGTDPKERGSKDEFYSFCKPYFKKKSTWDFKTLWRNIYFSDDGKTAWFEEQLDTWMEECRGSGVLIKRNGKWKLTHYNLTVLIENEKVKSFIKLRQD